MALEVHNTLSGKREPFRTVRPEEVRMYVCGVTVYDECHLGHARAYVSFDVIVRYLTFLGYRVSYVRNVTDVDDKIIARARKEGKAPEAIAQTYYEDFRRRMDELGLLAPQKEPRATQHIAQMHALIVRLIEKGMAYRVGEEVYYAVGRFAQYGKLSKRSPEEMQAGARVEINESKRDPMDFVLWKAAKPGEPAWDSPWGRGRPGWHVECSAMSMEYLGENFDLHGGGQDLIFPHHENELAQSQGATGRPLANFWVHNGFVMFRHHKMSKSLGNFFTLSALFEKYAPRVVKFFLLTKHYRSPLDFDMEELEESRKNLDKIDNALGLAQTALQGAAMPSVGEMPRLKEYATETLGRFTEAMDHDFNTPQALALVHEQVARLHGARTGKGDVAGTLRDLLVMLQVLGIPFKPYELKEISKESVLSEQEEAKLLASAELAEPQILSLIQARNHARRNKDFARADRIRNSMGKRGIVLRDEQGHTTWVKQ